MNSPRVIIIIIIIVIVIVSYVCNDISKRNTNTFESLSYSTSSIKISSSSPKSIQVDCGLATEFTHYLPFFFVMELRKSSSLFPYMNSRNKEDKISSSHNHEIPEETKAFNLIDNININHKYIDTTQHMSQPC